MATTDSVSASVVVLLRQQRLRVDFPSGANGIGNRNERFLAGERPSPVVVPDPSLCTQELPLVALPRGVIDGQGLSVCGLAILGRRTATAALVTLSLGRRPLVNAAPNTLRLAGSTPLANN